MLKATYGILNDILDYKNIPSVEKISNVLTNAAVINIKKTGGTSSSDWKVIADA